MRETACKSIILFLRGVHPPVNNREEARLHHASTGIWEDLCSALAFERIEGFQELLEGIKKSIGPNVPLGEKIVHAWQTMQRKMLQERLEEVEALDYRKGRPQ